VATERELKKIQEEMLYDIYKALKADDKTMRRMLKNMYERAQSGMSADEIDAVRERVSRSESDDI